MTVYLIDEAVRHCRREFIDQRYEEHCPVPTEDAIRFLGEQFDLHFLLNTLRMKVRTDRELRMVRVVPVEKEPVECDRAKIQSFLRPLFLTFMSPRLRIGTTDENKR
jgi:hypothetical protein